MDSGVLSQLKQSRRVQSERGGARYWSLEAYFSGPQGEDWSQRSLFAELGLCCNYSRGPNRLLTMAEKEKRLNLSEGKHTNRTLASALDRLEPLKRAQFESLWLMRWAVLCASLW